MKSFAKLGNISVKNWIRFERKKYLTEIANEVSTNAKRFWSYFSLKNGRKSVPDKVVYQGVTISEDRARVEAFNNYFQSVFKDHSDCQEDEVPLIIVDSRLGLIQVDSDEVRDYLRSLDVNKAIGPDQLPTIVLKECADSLAPSITAIINHGLRNGLHLTQWKCANIPPVYKKGKREEVVNFRPVSLLSVVSKVQERCVAKRLVPHVADVLHRSQHGFQEGKSYVTQLLEAFHSIGKSLDKGTETDIVYLDFAKAFDSAVCHARLLAKLRSFGITSPLLDLFRAYLSGRRQRVVINGTHSLWTRVGSGVPQGSILGLILFLLYINDMPDVVTNSLIVIFADDDKCFKVIDSLTGCIVFQNDLDSLFVWYIRACLHGGGEPQVGEVTRLAVVKN